jgi:hypothetical protein
MFSLIALSLVAPPCAARQLYYHTTAIFCQVSSWSFFLDHPAVVLVYRYCGIRWRSGLFAIEHLREGAWADNGDAGVGIQFQEVLVATDDDVGLARHSDFEEFIVFGVAADGDALAG